MTVSSQTSSVVARGNGVATSFQYSFRIPTADDIVVIYTDVNGVDTQLMPSQFSVSGLDSDAGGSVLYPLSGSPIPSGSSLTIERVLDVTQPSQFTNQGGYYPRVVEAAFDRVVMLIQQITAGVGTARALLFPSSDVSPTQTLPASAARANKYLAFDSSGNPIVLPGSSTSPDVSANTAKATSSTTARSLAARFADWCNVKDFGATGNGSTNDTAAIQAAIDYMAGLGGGDVLFPRGNYHISSITLKAEVRLIGDIQTPLTGGDGVVLQGIAAGTMVDTPVGGIFGCGMRGFSVLGASGSTNIGIHLRNVSNGEFTNLTILQTQDNALLCDAGVNSYFARINGYNVVLNRSRAAKTGAFDVSGTDHRICDIEFTCSQGARSDANLYVCAIALRGANHFIQKVVGHTSDIGVYIACSESRIDQPRAMNNYGHGFEFVNGTNTVVAAYSRANSIFAANTYDGFYLGATQGNTLVGCSAAIGSHKYGFEDTGAFSALASRNYYVNCRSSDHVTGAFAVNGSGLLGSTPLFQPLFLQTTNGDTTPSVEQSSLIGLNANTVPIVLTNFTKGVHGQTIDVFGSANVTIANNANIKTNTSANKLLRTNVMYRFTNLNGTWMEHGSQEAVSGVSVFPGANTVAVAFTNAQVDNLYEVTLGPRANETMWVTNITAAGFTLNSSNVASTALCYWAVTRATS